MRPPLNRSRRVRLAAAAVTATTTMALAAACGSPGAGNDSSSAGSAPVKIGIITAETGPYAPYGQEYLQGLRAGLSYVTHGTNKIAGHPVDLIVDDDADNPTTAVGDAKTLISQGARIIGGTVDSGIALQVGAVAAQNKVLYVAGPAAVDQLTNLNRYTFRSGRQTYQDVATAGSFLPSLSGKHILVLAQQSAFGQANLTGVQQVLGAKGAKVSGELIPLNATDFTPFAQKVIAAKPDLLFVAWAGSNAAQLWQTLDQQGVFAHTEVVTGLANTATYPATGEAGSKIEFLAHYFPGAGGGNPVEKDMTTLVTRAKGTVDLFTPDGFTAAQMFAHAIEASPSDTMTQIKALEGWSFQGVEGQYTIRAADHALLQPEFEAKLTGSGTNWTPVLVKTVPAGQIAPPPPAKPAWSTTG
jgi:branched-chain amino acid transport system substrate-binding protein